MNPERPPAGVVGEVAMVVIVETAMLSLNRKSSPPPAPVSTNLFPLASDTLKLTDAPLCVSVTVPNTVPLAAKDARHLGPLRAAAHTLHTFEYEQKDRLAAVSPKSNLVF